VTNKPMQVRGINFFRLANGKIVERWGQFDVLTMMQQLGLAPAPGGPPPQEG
jgi:predicted ester cyclase